MHFVLEHLLSGSTMQAICQLRWMTYNVRLDTPEDVQDPWWRRREHIAALMRFHVVDVAGLQEPLRHQCDDLASRLPGYAWVGRGRDDGVDGGEFTPVFYRREVIDLLAWQVDWLAPPPAGPGQKGWDAGAVRTMTTVLLRHRQTGQRIRYGNTHLDYHGPRSRLESARLIASWATSCPEAVVAGGDWNEPSDAPGQQVLAQCLQDASTISAEPVFGPQGTFPGFAVGSEEGPALDRLWLSSGITVRRLGKLNGHARGRHHSDHLPVVADLVFEGTGEAS
jgi:endonuclease/exonuclease/phosphatase family metal-dependent hydrolase